MSKRWPRSSAPVVVGWSLAALCLGSALALGPISRATSPWLAVRVASEFGGDRPVYGWSQGLFADGSGFAVAPDALLDPWGRPWRAVQVTIHFRKGPLRSETYTTVYSVGPDGVDDQLSGDDVALDPSEQVPAVASVIPVRALKSPRFVLLVAAMLLGVYTFAAWKIPPVHRRTVRDEVLVAGGLALPWALPALAWARTLRDEIDGQATIRALQQRGLVVPFTGAAVGSVRARGVLPRARVAPDARACAGARPSPDPSGVAAPDSQRDLSTMAGERRRPLLVGRARAPLQDLHHEHRC